MSAYDDLIRTLPSAPRTWLVTGVAGFIGSHLLETPLSTDQETKEHADGTLEITGTVIDNAMLDWWLRGFGDAIQSVTKQSKSA